MLTLLTCLLLHPAEEWLQAIVVAEKLPLPFAVAFDSTGGVYFVEFQGHRLGRLDDKGQPSYLAGTGVKGNRDGLAGVSAMNSPHNLAVAPGGVIYVSDTFNHTIRKYDPATKELTTVAGIGKPGYDGDVGLAGAASFNETYHVALDAEGKNLYVADLKNQRVRRIDLEKEIVSTVAGNGKKETPVEGADALASPLNDPRAVVVDKSGQLYILQRGGNDLWKVDLQGKMRRVAGTGKKGYSGDGGLALEATLAGPKHLCFDSDGNVLIADTDNHCIRRVNLKDGTIHLVAGRGTGAVPNRAESIQLKEPHGVTVKPGSKVIFIADSGNNRIIKLVPFSR